jgi:hypothetical protein
MEFQTYISSVITTATLVKASDVLGSIELLVVGLSPITFRETLFSDEAETDFSLKQCDIGGRARCTSWNCSQ